MMIDNITRENGYLLSWYTCVEGEEYRPLLQTLSVRRQNQQPVPGFRPGKAPLSAALNYYGNDFYAKAMPELLNAIYCQTVSEQGFEPVGEPQFFSIQANEQKISFSTSVNVYPEIVLKEYKGLKAYCPPDKVTEDELDRELERFCDLHRRVEPVDEGAAGDDIVYFSCSGECEGKVIDSTVTTGVMQRLDQEDIFPGLKEAMRGRCKGETFILETDIPAEDRRGDIAGRHLTLHVRVDGVSRRYRQQLSDALVNKHHPDCHTVEEYREKLRGERDERCRKESERVFREEVRKALIAQVEAEFPPEMIEKQLKTMYFRLAGGLSMIGKGVKQYLEENNMSMEKLRELSMGPAVDELKAMVALEEVARLEGIDEEDDKKREDKAFALVLAAACPCDEGPAV